MDRREGAILKAREAAHEVEVVLVAKGRTRIEWTGSAEWAADDLCRDACRRHGFCRVKRDVSSRLETGDARDRVHREPADCQGRLVDVREDVVEPPPHAHMAEG